MGNPPAEEDKMKGRPLGIAIGLGIYFCLFLWLPACKKEAAGPKVETIDCVIYVHNPATPLHPRRTVAFEEDFTFKEKDEAGEIRIYKPGRFIVDGQGNVYIEDDSDMAIKVFDPQGKYLRAIGRKGNGPGEFENIGYLFILPDGRLMVTDYGNRRTSFLDTDGKYLSSFQWRRSMGQVHLASDTSITLSEYIYSEEKSELWIKTVDQSGEEVINFGQFTQAESKTLRQGSMMMGTTVPWSPSSVFAGDQKRQWLYHCLNIKYVIEAYDSQGKLFRKIDRPYEPVPVTDEDINKIKSEYADRPDSPFAKLIEQMTFPEVKTVTERMLVDSDGNLWVETNEEMINQEGEEKEKKTQEKPLKAYDIFNSDGVYENRVWTDIRPILFANGKMYRLVEDEETGLRQLKRYRIIWQ
jgi:hypothetical protein